MNSTIRKILSLLFIIVIAFGLYVSAFGIGPVKNLKDSLKYGLDINGGVYVVMEAETDMTGTELKTTMEQTRNVLERRVDAMGVANATVSVEGEKRIRVEMPGVSDAESAINRIGETAQLRFTTSDNTQYLSGEDVKDATADVDSENGGYKIVLTFTKEGQKKFAEATAKASSGSITPTVQDEEGNTVDSTAVVIWLDENILTAPTCDETIDSESCEITNRGGGMSRENATEEAALIRGGALPVSLVEVESSVQSASIGENALDKSIVAGAIGLALVFLIMILVYNLLGLFADIALVLYVMIVLWAMVGLNAVLTLPGIAGLILGVGMAVDANVIIFSRIKEEIGMGRSIRVAVDEGFRHALVTVMDSQITTLIATIVLYQLGSTAVKGFAITLMISIIVSIFTAVFVTQCFVDDLADSSFAKNTLFGCKEDGTPKKFLHKYFDIIDKRKIFYIISACVFAAGILFFAIRGFNYGIDFTGGTMLEVDMGKKVSAAEISKSIKDFGLNESIVFSGEDGNTAVIKTTKALNASERDEVTDKIIEEFKLGDDAVKASEEFGATIGSEIRTNAIKSILIAALFMLAYIIIRFRSWKYGVAAVAGIAHDVLVLLSMYAIFHFTVNNPFIAVLLTIVGYSINDTIVIFDRIRENRKLMRGKPLVEILNASINQTLDRSIMTSITTFVAIIPLLFLVSSSLAGFVIPLMIGVICGTYSSIFICSPLYYEFNRREEMSRYEAQERAKKRIEDKKAKKESKKQPENEVIDVPESEQKEAVSTAAAETESKAKATKKKGKKKKSSKKNK
ncbi:MAG: protein translocase subunit SecD [Eubacterium sp.]|nr:protein translocase subunit SecD [Eubacterium sp.]